MSIYRVSRNGAELGQFPESELIRGMSHGQFFQDDFVWREGMADWQPLNSLLPHIRPPQLRRRCHG
jgi:hypothetical protein